MTLEEVKAGSARQQIPCFCIWSMWASDVEIGGCCSSCSARIDINRYKCLLELSAEKEREKQRKIEEQRRQQEEHRRQEEEQRRQKEKTEAEEFKRQQEQLRIQQEEALRQEAIIRSKQMKIQEGAKEIEQQSESMDAYSALKIARRVFSILGWVCIGLGVLLITIIVALGTISPENHPFGISAFAAFEVAVGAALLSLCCFVAAELLRAIRHIAINSARQLVIMNKMPQDKSDSN